MLEQLLQWKIIWCPSFGVKPTAEVHTATRYRPALGVRKAKAKQEKDVCPSCELQPCSDSQLVVSQS